MNSLPAVDADVNYLGPTQGPPQTRIYPPSSGIATVRPPQEGHRVSISDARPIAPELRLDDHGFAVHSCPSQFTDFYDDDAVRSRYYPEVRAVVRSFLSALEVIVFDHNVRSAA